MIEEKCAAVGMPKPENGMNKRADRRRVNRFASLRPTLKGMVRRPLEGKERLRAKDIGKAGEGLFCPGVHGVGAIGSGCGEMPPESGTCVTNHDERFGRSAEIGSILLRNLKTTPEDEALGGQGIAKFLI